ncbi:MAG: PaaI family thioesterase, partial [Proteobacteria bacterium]|nr:PaaI family thioesterase [Pseudomonadota bacterium]
MPRISIEELDQICEQSLPWAGMMGFEIAEIGKGTCRVRLPQSDRFLRPGGTISGPALMSLADYAMYVAVLSRIGRVE